MTTLIQDEMTAPPEGTEDMSDSAFLDCLDAHTGKPRPGYTPLQMARLLRMCNANESAKVYDGLAPRSMACEPKAIRECLEQARAWLSEKEKMT